MTERRFTPVGPLALQPQAFGMLVMEMPEPPCVEYVGQTAIVSIRGPLEHHASAFCDSYDAIKARIVEALGTSPRAIVLSIDSPGGLVSGCFNTAREIKALCADARVPVYTFVDGTCASAAYVLGCIGQRISVPEAGMVGSIGIIDAILDTTRQDAAMGMRFSFIASGARKTDGNQHVATSDEAIAVAQARVDSMAQLFFSYVSESRPLAPEAVAGLQAGIRHGAEAVAAGLADDVCTLDQLLAQIASGAIATVTKPEVPMSAYEDAIAALRKAAASDDEKVASSAKRMLAAEFSEDEKPAEETPPASEEPAEEPATDEDAKSVALAAKAEVMALKAQIIATSVAAERTALLATRPDLDEATKKLLANETPEKIRSWLATLPVIPGRAAKLAASASVTGTQGAPGGHMTREQANAAVGIVTPPSGMQHEGNKSSYHAMTPAEARAHLAAKGGAR
jgi:ClpP class serine protease